jgi:hypothetical protein
MPDETPPQSEIILYQTEDGRTRIQCRLQNETIWLTQALIAELFQKDVRTINEHLVNIYDEMELDRQATIRKFRIVRLEGSREVSREIEHYSLPAILAVGYRVRSHRGTQFRQWATARLSEYLVKGFTMDDERLKNPPGKGQNLSAFRNNGRRRTVPGLPHFDASAARGHRLTAGPTAEGRGLTHANDRRDRCRHRPGIHRSGRVLPHDSTQQI